MGTDVTSVIQQEKSHAFCLACQVCCGHDTIHLITLGAKIDANMATWPTGWVQPGMTLNIHILHAMSASSIPNPDGQLRLPPGGEKVIGAATDDLISY